MPRQTRSSNRNKSQILINNTSVPIDDIPFDIPGSVTRTPISMTPKTPVSMTPKTPAPRKQSGSVTVTPIVSSRARIQSVPGPKMTPKTSAMNNSTKKPGKRAASPDIIVDDEIRVNVGKSVKISKISDVKTQSNLNLRRSSLPSALSSSTRNLPATTKVSPVTTSTSSSPAIVRKINISSTPAPARKGPPGPPGPPGPSTPKVGPPGPSPLTSKVPGPPGPAKKPVSKPVENHKCEDCGKSFTAISKLNTHRLAVHRVSCKKCKEKFDTKELLAMHEVDHMIKCKYCTEMFDSEDEHKEHLDKSHKIICSKCDKFYYTNEDVEKHERVDHHNPCHKCNLVLDSKKELKEHIELLHTFPCEYCKFTADETEKLEDHENNVHKKCEECEDEFTWVESHHKCYFTDKNISPKSERVVVQNMYFENFTYYFI